MTINIKRKNSTQEEIQSFNVDSTNALEALEEIKEKQDQSLAYRCGCRSGVCGSCSIKINGVEKLACKSQLKENDHLEPLNHAKVIKDLVISLDHEEKVLKKPKAFLEELSQEVVTQADEKIINTQSNCILCQSCYSSCPVFAVNKEFLGPYALTRVLRYLNDKKESNSKNKLELIQQNGVWDCTLCGNCTMVCPQFIDPKTDIMNLRAKAVQAGYQDPNMMSFEQNEFSSGFDPTGGFNPSGGFDPNGF